MQRLLFSIVLFFLASSAWAQKSNFKIADPIERDNLEYKESGKRAMLPIALRCPNSSNNKFEVYSQDGDGYRMRITIVHRNSTQADINSDRVEKSAIVTAALAMAGQDWEERLSVDLIRESSDHARKSAILQILLYDELRQNICLGPKKEKQRYFEHLKSNAQKVGATASMQ